MKTIIISSSISKKSRSFILCQEIYNRLKIDGVETELIDARKIELVPHHINPTKSMLELSKKVESSNNIIIGMGVHCYSINDSLKIILDNCFEGAKEKFFGIICAAGGERSYLSTGHLTQICMNEWRMIQLPRIIYATGKDFKNDSISNKELLKRLDDFAKEFKSIGEKLMI